MGIFKYVTQRGVYLDLDYLTDSQQDRTGSSWKHHLEVVNTLGISCSLYKAK